MKTINKHVLIIFFYFILTTFALTGFFINGNGKVIGNINHPNSQGEILLTDIMKKSLCDYKILNWTNTNFLNYPYGEQLSETIKHTFHLYISGTLAIFINTISAYNITFFIIILFNAYCMFLLANFIFKSYRLSFLAGLFYMFNIYVLLKINMGSLHKSSIFFIPLYILFLLKLADTPKVSYLILTFILLILNHLQYPMYSLYCLIFSVIFITYRLLKNKKIKEFKYFIAIIVLSFIFLYWIGAVGKITTDMYFYENDPWNLNFMYPIKNYLAHPTALPVGISPIILFLALIGFFYTKTARFYFLTAIFFIILSFGYFITINSMKIPLPFYFLTEFIKFFSGMILHAPIRALPMAYVCLIISAIFGVKIICDKFGKKIIYIMAAAFFLELFFLYPELFPIKTTNIIKYDIAGKIKNKNGNILFLPLFDNANKVLLHKSMMITLIATKKLANTYETESWVKKIIETNKPSAILEILKQHMIKFIIIYTDLEPSNINEKALINSIKEKTFQLDKKIILYEID